MHQEVFDGSAQKNVPVPIGIVWDVFPIYPHHGSWWVYYREEGRPVRERIAACEMDAEHIAAQINAQLASRTPTLLSFMPISINDLRESYLNHHENVLRSSVSTIRRYRAATQHLVDFVSQTGPSTPAHEIRVDRFAAFLRSRKDIFPGVALG